MYLWLLDDKSFIRSPHKRFYLKQNYPDILSEFDSISFKESLPFFQLFWHFLQEDYELKLGLCPVCGKRCDFLFTRLKGYRKHCSFECYQSDAGCYLPRLGEDEPDAHSGGNHPESFPVGKLSADKPEQKGKNPGVEHYRHKYFKCAFHYIYSNRMVIKYCFLTALIL